MKKSRICTISLAATAAAVLSIPVGAAPAFATSSGVTVTYTCTEPPFPGGESDFTLTVKAPKLVLEGQRIDLKATLGSVDASKVDVPAQGVNTTLDITVGGAISTTVTATGLTNAAAVPTGQQVLQTGGTASLNASAPGLVTYKPGEFVTTTWMDTVLDCTPNSTSVLAQTVVLPF